MSINELEQQTNIVNKDGLFTVRAQKEPMHDGMSKIEKKYDLKIEMKRKAFWGIDDAVANLK